MIVYHSQHPNVPTANIWGSGISLGWVAVLLGVYNLYKLVRWWNVRSYQANLRKLEEIRWEREHRSRLDIDKRDPTFDFSDKPDQDSGR